MIICYPGQNCAFGGQRFRMSLTGIVGTFAQGDIVATGGTAAIVEKADNTNGVLACLARAGVFQIGNVVVGPSGSGTIETVSDYSAPRGMFDALTTAPVAGYFAEQTQNYRLGDAAKWVVNTTVDLIFDRGAGWNSPTRVVADPDTILISGFSVDDFNGLQNTTALQSVQIGFGAAAAGPFTTVATITNGTPSAGVGAFGQGQLFARFSQVANNRFIRVRFVSTGPATITIGNIWVGDGVDSISGENWQFNDRFTITQIDRAIGVDLWGGGESRTKRKSIRQFDGVASFVQSAYDKLLDLVNGQYGAYAEPEHPVAICFDPTNQMRDVVGQHMHAGLFIFNGNPTAQDVRVLKNNLWFWPSVPMKWKEWR